MTPTAALQSEQAGDGVYVHHYIYHRKDGKSVSFFAPSGVEEPMFEQINSVYFEDGNKFLELYSVCSQALPVIAKKLQDRESFCEQNEESAAFNAIRKALQSLVPNLEITNLQKETLDISLFTKFEIEREMRNIDREIKERESTIESCNTGKCAYKNISDSANLSRLQSETENLKTTYSELGEDRRGLNDIQQPVFAPEELKRRWEELKDGVNHSMGIMPEETLIEVLGEEDYDTLKRVIDEWLPTIEKSQLPTLTDAIETKKVNSFPLSESLNFSHVMGIIREMGIKNIASETMSEIESTIKESDRKKLTLKCDEGDEDLDYEFVSNPYVYAYFKYLVEQNEAANKEYIRKICEKACRDELISPKQEQSVSSPESKNVSIEDENEQNSLPGNDDSALSTPSLPDDQNDFSETNEAINIADDTEDDSNTSNSNEDAIKNAIKSLRKSQNLDTISKEEIVKRISTIGSIEQNLLLAYLTTFFSYTGKKSISSFLISNGAPENYSEVFDLALKAKFNMHRQRNICLIYGGEVTIELTKKSPNCFELNIQTEEKEIHLGKLNMGSLLFSTINNKNNWTTVNIKCQ